MTTHAARPDASNPSDSTSHQGHPMSEWKAAYGRVLLKLSGESFCKPGGFGIDPDELHSIASEVQQAAKLGAEVAVVVGGGNIIRGAELAAAGHIHQATADHMGMLGTVINALALKEKLLTIGTDCRVMSAIEIRAVAEPFIRNRAIRHMEKGRIIILAAGTGNPYFTTDTCAALRATELECDVLLKATKVDGIYTADPVKDPSATRYEEISYLQVLQDRLQVMDATAISLCMDNKLPIVVFNLRTPGNVRRVVSGEPVGTTVTS